MKRVCIILCLAVYVVSAQQFDDYDPISWYDEVDFDKLFEESNEAEIPNDDVVSSDEFANNSDNEEPISQEAHPIGDEEQKPQPASDILDKYIDDYQIEDNRSELKDDAPVSNNKEDTPNQEDLLKEIDNDFKELVKNSESQEAVGDFDAFQKLIDSDDPLVLDMIKKVFSENDGSQLDLSDLFSDEKNLKDDFVEPLPLPSLDNINVDEINENADDKIEDKANNFAQDEDPEEDLSFIIERTKKILEETNNEIAEINNNFKVEEELNDDNVEKDDVPDQSIVDNDSDEDSVAEVYKDLNDDLEKLLETMNKLRQDKFSEEINPDDSFDINILNNPLEKADDLELLHGGDQGDAIDYNEDTQDYGLRLGEEILENKDDAVPYVYENDALDAADNNENHDTDNIDSNLEDEFDDFNSDFYAAHPKEGNIETDTNFNSADSNELDEPNPNFHPADSKKDDDQFDTDFNSANLENDFDESNPDFHPADSKKDDGQSDTDFNSANSENNFDESNPDFHPADSKKDDDQFDTDFNSANSENDFDESNPDFHPADSKKDDDQFDTDFNPENESDESNPEFHPADSKKDDDQFDTDFNLVNLENDFDESNPDFHPADSKKDDDQFDTDFNPDDSENEFGESNPNFHPADSKKDDDQFDTDFNSANSENDFDESNTDFHPADYKKDDDQFDTDFNPDDSENEFDENETSEKKITKNVEDLTGPELDQLTKQFIQLHKNELDADSKNFKGNAEHMLLNAYEPVVLTSPGYPSPYPTTEDSPRDWILDGEGHGIELNVTDLNITSANGHYLLVKPGAVDASGSDGIVFAFHLNEPRKYRFRDVDRLFVRFEGRGGMPNFRGFSMSVKMIEPLSSDDEEMPEPESLQPPPRAIMTLLLGGVNTTGFEEVREEFRLLLADMATRYINANGIDPGNNSTRFTTQITRTYVCNLNWPGFDTCVEVRFAIPLVYDEEDPENHRLNEDDLIAMWHEYIGQDPFASRLRRMGITEFTVPKDGSVLLVWLVIAAGVLVSMMMLACTLWRFSCFNGYTRHYTQADTDSLHNEKRGLDMYPTPHQTLPPLYAENEYKWSDNNFDDTKVDINGFTNRSYVRGDISDDSDIEITRDRVSPSARDSSFV